VQLSEPDSNPGLAARLDELRAALRSAPPELLAERTGASYSIFGPTRGEFRLSLLDTALILTFPDLISVNTNEDIMPVPIQALLLYYFYTSDGAPLGGQWVSFADLPDGRIYNPAFQGYSGDSLAKAFGLQAESFRQACEKTGGRANEFGETAYRFQALPRVPILVTYWLGDVDFPSSCKILFEESVSHYLPTDVCAILGSMLTHRILKAR
jgi:hypothetical protein